MTIGELLEFLRDHYGPLPLMLTVRQFVAHFNVCRTQTYALMESEELESVMVGRSRRIPLLGALKWMLALPRGGLQENYRPALLIHTP
ncbi:MAG: hypothetical protein KF748_08045 [Xanthobacteraceae bacterium]|nr:hypothetical protein [Xanthobacteraceae bacterium]MCW5676621.1 hypothetical protein [Xanthobacteraceae bacterium]